MNWDSLKKLFQFTKETYSNLTSCSLDNKETASKARLRQSTRVEKYKL